MASASSAVMGRGVRKCVLRGATLLNRTPDRQPEKPGVLYLWISGSMIPVSEGEAGPEEVLGTPRRPSPLCTQEPHPHLPQTQAAYPSLGLDTRPWVSPAGCPPAERTSVLSAGSSPPGRGGRKPWWTQPRPDRTKGPLLTANNP